MRRTSGTEQVRLYLERSEQVRKSVESNTATLQAAIRQLHRALMQSEYDLDELRRLFNQVPGKGASRLALEWHVGDLARSRLGPNGPYALIYSLNQKASARSLGRWPHKREVQRWSDASRVDDRWALLMGIKSAYKAHQVLRLAISKTLAVTHDIDQTYNLGVPVPQAPQRSRAPASDAVKHRYLWSEFAAGVTQALHESIREKEHELTVLKNEFNQVGKKRNGSLMAAFEVRKTRKERLVGLYGPTFFSLDFFSQTRRRKRLKTGNPPRNIVTRKALEKRYLMKHSQTLLPLAERIVDTRDTRHQEQAALKRIYDALKNQTQGQLV